MTPFASLFTVTNENNYDNYGNLLSNFSYTSDGISTFTRTEYNNDTSSWILGMPNRIRVAESDPDAGGTVLRETEITYHASEPWLVDQKKAIHWQYGFIRTELSTSYTYDSYGNVTSVTDPRGKTSHVTYDSNGMFPVTTKNAENHIVTRTFDPALGKVLTETGPNSNQTTTYTYDEFGRKQTVLYPDNSSETYTYNVQAGNHSMTVQSTGQPTATVYYDNFGRKKEEEVTGGSETIFKQTTYDNAGRVTAESQPYFSGGTVNWTTFQYDPQRGYMNRQDNPDGTYKTVSKNGFTETVTDEKGHSRTVTRDSLGRNKSILEPYETGDEANSTGGTTYYTYDIFGNLLTTQDPEGNITTITYDDLGRKISMDDTYMGYWQYDYDENGNLITQRDSENRVINITYDDINRMLTKTYVADNNRVVTHTYDQARSGYYNIGSLTTLYSPEASYVFNYDNMGRQVNETRTIDSIPYQIDTGYDMAGRLDYIIYPDNEQYDYAYDSMGNLISVSNGAKTYAHFTINNPLGLTDQVTYGNGTITDYSYYTGNFRLASLETYDNINRGYLIQSIDYTFDYVGNITDMTVTTLDETYTVNHTFTYDSLDRLRTADAESSDPTRIYNQDYHYDQAGNMTKKVGTGGWEVLSWLSDTDKPRIAPQIVRFDSEVAGVAQRNIIYNQDQKPVHITYNGGVTDLTYDGAGERIKKVKGNETVIYVGGIYEIRDGQAMSHIFANGQKIVTIAGSKEYYSHSDHLGSTSVVTDETGTIVEEIGYLPFGATLFRNAFNGSSWESAYRFTGQEFDDEYHLYNYNARLYDPIMSRFITPDTIVPNPYNPQSLNRYSYCLNNPLRYIDPSGHATKEELEEAGYVQDPKTGEWTLLVMTVTPHSWYEDIGFYPPAIPWCDLAKELDDARKQQELFVRQEKYIHERIPLCVGTGCDECEFKDYPNIYMETGKVEYKYEWDYTERVGATITEAFIIGVKVGINVIDKSSDPRKFNPTYFVDNNNIVRPFVPHDFRISAVIGKRIPLIEKAFYTCTVEMCTQRGMLVNDQRRHCYRTSPTELVEDRENATDIVYISRKY